MSDQNTPYDLWDGNPYSESFRIQLELSKVKKNPTLHTIFDENLLLFEVKLNDLDIDILLLSLEACDSTFWENTKVCLFHTLRSLDRQILKVLSVAETFYHKESFHDPGFSRKITDAVKQVALELQKDLSENE